MSNTDITRVQIADTFQVWLSKTNELIDLANENTMLAGPNGFIIDGNSTLTGVFTANTLVADSNLILPSGTTAERPTPPVVGSLRFNTEIESFEGYNGNEWSGIGDEAGLGNPFFIVDNYEAEENDYIIADSSIDSFSIILPEFPVEGSIVRIATIGAKTNNIIIIGNGNTFEGSANQLTIDDNFIVIDLIFSGFTWRVFKSFRDTTIIPDTTTNDSRSIIFSDISDGETFTLFTSKDDLSFNPSTKRLSLINFQSSGNTSLANTSITTLAVSGNTSLANTSITTLAVSGNTSISALTVSGNTSLANTSISALTVSSNTSLANTSISALTVSGNTSLANTEISTLSISGNSALKLPAGTTAQRPDGIAGHIRFNQDNSSFEVNDGSIWKTIGVPNLLDDTTTNESRFITFSELTSGATEELLVSSTKLFFNPSSGELNATSFNSLSDVSYKENIFPIKSALDIVDKISGVEFEWKQNSKKSAGVIAQQLEEILPHAVSENGGIKSVNYSILIAYLIEAIKELKNNK